MKQPKREIIKQKFGGLCAYSGTPLKEDWQVEHILPVERDLLTNKPKYPERNHIDNLIPVQKILNHYKHSLSLEEFRNWLLGGLHLRLAKLPKKTNSPTTIKRAKYLWEVADLFGITPEKPFNKKFYFETT